MRELFLEVQDNWPRNCIRSVSLL